MSYLFPISDTTTFGVVEVGNNIIVANGIISIQQSVDPTASVTFANISDSSLLPNGIVFATANGLLSDSANFIFNPSLNILSVPNINVVNASVTGNLTLNGNSVITSVIPTAGNGISLSNVTTSGPNAKFTVTNTGVLNITAGTGITVSSATGNVTIAATGSTVINTKGVGNNYTLGASDDYVGATTGSITLTLPAGTTGQSFILKNESGSGDVNVFPTSPDTIDGANSKRLSSNASITVVYRAGAWRII